MRAIDDGRIGDLTQALLEKGRKLTCTGTTVLSSSAKKIDARLWLEMHALSLSSRPDRGEPPWSRLYAFNTYTVLHSTRSTKFVSSACFSLPGLLNVHAQYVCKFEQIGARS